MPHHSAQAPPTDSKLSSQIIKRRCEKRTISSGLAQLGNVQDNKT